MSSVATIQRTPRRGIGGWLSKTRPPSAVAIGRVTILCLGALVVMAPVVWAVLSSFKSPAELAQRPPALLPQEFSLRNYADALGKFRFLQYLLNSIIATAGATAVTLIINSLAAFALSKYNFRGRDLIFIIMLSTIMVPLQVILIPVYQMLARLGLVNSLWGLIIPPAATPTGVFLLRQYMLTIPDELIEAARIDGARDLTIFLKIVLPLSLPALSVLAIFSVMWRWNDFLWPLLVAQREELYTLPLAIARFNSELVVPFNLVLAASVLSMVPVFVAFLFLQRQIVAGISQTGIR